MPNALHRIAAALLTLVLAAALSAVPLPREGERWTRLQVENIVVFSNAADGVTRTVAENVARLRLALNRVSGLQVQSPVPVYLYVFRDEPSFAPYRQALTGSTKEVIAGAFTHRARAGYAIMLAGRGMVDHVVAHEMMHGYIRNTVVGVPLWLDEGLAEFYAGLTPVADSVRLGMPEPQYVEELTNHGLMPLRELFTFQPDLIHQGDVSLMRFYAESWLFANYLLIGQPARGRQLGDFLTRLDDGAPLDDAFQQAFHAKMTDVDADLGAYLRRSRFNYMVYPKSELGEVRAADPQPMERVDTLVALADLLLVTDAWHDAAPFLAKALELDPKNAAALALWGRFREGEDKLDEAVALYDRAVGLDSADVRPFAFASNSLVSRLQVAQHDGVTPAKAEVEKVRRIAGAGLKRAPSDPDLLATMGASYTFAGEDPKAGIAWSAKAFSIAPSRIDVACDLVLLYARAGKANLAKAMIDRVIARSDRQDLLESASQNLTLADFETAEELLAAGKAPEAKLLLERVRTSTKNPKLKAAAEAKLGEK